MSDGCDCAWCREPAYERPGFEVIGFMNRYRRGAPSVNRRIWPSLAEAEGAGRTHWPDRYISTHAVYATKESKIHKYARRMR